MKKTLTFFGIFIFLALIIVGFNAWRSGMITRADLKAFAARKETVIEPNGFRDGTVVCLPQSNTGAARGTCVLGLKTVEGESYELLDVLRAGPTGTVQEGSEVRIIGDIVVARKKKLVGVTKAIKVERVQETKLE